MVGGVWEGERLVMCVVDNQKARPEQREGTGRRRGGGWRKNQKDDEWDIKLKKGIMEMVIENCRLQKGEKKGEKK